MNGPSHSAMTTRYQVTIGLRTISIEILESSAGTNARVDGGPLIAVERLRPRDDYHHVLNLDGELTAALVDGSDGSYSVVLQGLSFDVVVEDERTARLASIMAGARRAASDSSVSAPMPGLVVAVNVEPGQEVAKGQSLVVLQAMKMENDLAARDGGRVAEVLVVPGQTVDRGQTLIRLE